MSRTPSDGDRMMGFAGMERDTVTGLNLAVNRVQKPGTGRWTSQDPLGFAAGDADLYRFVRNSPTNFTDKSGLVITEAQKNRLLNLFQKLRSEGASCNEMVMGIIIELLYVHGGNNAEALSTVYSLRNDFPQFDNDIWASVDHFFNAWNTRL